MIGSRACFALMRRNCIYRKRNWLGSIFELILPFCFVWILVALRNAVDVDDTSSSSSTNTNTTTNNNTTTTMNNNNNITLYVPEYIPTDYTALIPFSYYDYVIALQAKRVCTTRRDRDLEISGLHDFGNNWQVPFIKCNSIKCLYLGQDAQPFCEYSILAIAGSTYDDIGGRSRAVQFQQWMYQKWPILNNSQQQQQSSTFDQNDTDSGVLPFDFDFVQIFDSSDAMDEYIRQSDYGTNNIPKIGMGIIFVGNSTTEYKYHLRQNSTNMNVPHQTIDGNPVSITTPPTNRLFNNYARTDFDTCSRGRADPKLGLLDDSCTGLYVYNGIIATQRLVGDFILYDTNSGYTVADGGVSYVQFPQKAFVASGFFATVEDTAPLLIILGLLFPVASMIGYVVQEKQLRQKELMKMMSVVESDIGWAWFITFASFNIVAAMCAAIVSTVLYNHSSLSLLSLFWILSILATTVYCMTMSTFTSKASRGILVGLLVFFSGVFLTLAVHYQTGSPTAIALICLHPAATFAYGIKILGYLEDLNLGLDSDTLIYSEGISQLSMMNILQYLCLDTLLWGILSWYFNRVIAPDFGQALPFWFPFDLSYWFPSWHREIETGDEDGNNNTITYESNLIPIEPVSDTLKGQAKQGKSIEIQNLRKDYGDTIAVDGLNLSMYSGQISALLGHNGAGKTTTISMLTGATAATSGHASVLGKNIRKDMSKIRQDIGICLQHDCLFPQLTVREHLQFFARLKGLYSTVSYFEAEQQIDQSLIDVALSEKRSTLSKNLSGGMKRKLSVAIAFCGGSKVVLLDEPTSGMDPFSRRFTWNVIRQYKKDRIIILTTHFMDEADILGDRIAIMAEGQLRCVGSSLFLKKTYGVGYQLTIDRGRNNVRLGSDGHLRSSSANHRSTVDHSCNDDVNKICQIVTTSVPDATLLGNVGSELSYKLPLNAASLFAPMFTALDEQVEEGLISCYGVSITTLNEVFLMVARGETPTNQVNEHSSRLLRSNLTDDIVKSDSEEGEEHGISIELGTEQSHQMLEQQESTIETQMDDDFTRHVGALLMKRGLYFRRDRKAWICTTIVPSMFVLVGFLIFALTGPNLNMEPLILDPKDYNVDYGVNQISFNSPENPFICQPGICSHRQPYYVDTLVDEQYAFCGYQSKLGISLDGFISTNQSCTIPGSAELMSALVSDNFFVEEANVENITEGSTHLSIVAGSYPFTKYGAIWFSHLQESITEGILYNETVIRQCEATTHLVNYSADCGRFDGVGYTVQYNYTALHASLLFEKLANEALVRHGTNNSEIQVETTIAPLPVTIVEESIGAGTDAFLVWFLVVVSFPFIGGAFGSFVVHEKSSKAKHLQTVAGVEPAAYWLSTYIWDVINYQIPLWTTIALMFIFDVDILTTKNRDIFSGIATILFLFGPALAGFTYCVSFAFKSASSCNVFVIISGFLIGMGGPLTCSILIILSRDPRDPNPNLENVSNILAWILRFTPTFCLGKGLFNAINIELFLYLEGNETLTAWTEPILLYEVYFLAGQCLLFPLIAVQLDKWSSNPYIMSLWRKLIRGVTLQWLHKQNLIDAVSGLPDDDDVLMEQQLVESGQANGDRIVIKNLTKIFDDGKVAVNNMCLGIAPGECFGLLGINGAGKTTTLGMLTAEFPPTSGDAILCGFSVAHEPQKVRRLIGYCPQFDALFGCLTGREHLFLYGAIKGIPKNSIYQATENKLKEVGLAKTDWDRMSREYSGGMKRRLSLACATIGQPRLIFLDECSTGVDPMSRRDIWKLVSKMLAGDGITKVDKPSIILTTHNMDECEALCPRIGIMANGKLRCLGSAQHLKDKFGHGYQVELNVKIVRQLDDDYLLVKEKLEQLKSRLNVADNINLNLEQCKSALTSLEEYSFLSNLVTVENSEGFTIWKDASSPQGVTIDDLTNFVASEIRMVALEKFISETFEKYVLRERQDTKVRYEINDDNLRISRIFTSIEENKNHLRLADYGVSQTTLEQVFNIHAAEAENQKSGRLQLNTTSIEMSSSEVITGSNHPDPAIPQ